MQCPFCSAANPRSTGACHVCGGPLRGTNFHPASPRVKPNETATTPVFHRASKPLPTVPPATPVLLARRAVEKNAPRIVAALWNGENGSLYPLLVPESGAMQLWDVQHDILHPLPIRRAFHKPSLTTAAAFASLCAIVATGHASGQVHLHWLEPQSGHLEWKLHVLEAIEAHRGRVLSLADAGTRLYSAGSDGAVVLTRLPDAPNLKWALNGSPEVVLDGFDALSSLALSPDGRLLALGGDDGRVQMWHLAAEGAEARLDWTSRKDASPLKSLVFAPNGNMLMSCNARGCLCVRAAQTGHELVTQSQSGAAPPDFAPDSRLLAIANAQNGIHLFDAWTGTLRHTLPPVSGGVQALVFSPATESLARETLLVVAGAQELAVWEVPL